MNSAQLVNLIIQKLRRVEFLVIQNRPVPQVRFSWGGNDYLAAVNFDDSIAVYRRVDGYSAIDSYQRHVEDRLNGLVRNDAARYSNFG